MASISGEDMKFQDYLCRSVGLEPTEVMGLEISMKAGQHTEIRVIKVPEFGELPMQEIFQITKHEVSPPIIPPGPEA